MEESIKILRQAIKHLPEGNVHEVMPKKIRPNVGEVYSRYESARGDVGFYIISDGKVIAHGKPKEIVKDKIVQSVYLGDNFKL